MKKISIILMMSTVLIIAGCQKIDETKESTPLPEKQIEIVEDDGSQEKEPIPLEAEEEIIILREEGTNIIERYATPLGFTRQDVEGDSFGEFLREQKLKPYGEKALYYDGREKKSQGVYDSVFEVDIGDRDLHQCADAIMLLRAEYLYAQERYDEITFNFVSGFPAEYKKWMDGNRIKVDGNQVSYKKSKEPSNSYDSFRQYMTMVMAYASTLSMEKELESVEIENMEIGDVFIVGGSPGHAIIVVDMAVNDEEEKVFMLAQSYMPAQQTQILINPSDEKRSPWYSLTGQDRLITPEWNFDLNTLKRFPK